MKNKQTYKKGDKVWVEIPVEGGAYQNHLALILAAILTPAHHTNEIHFAIRCLDQEGTTAYQCIPESWIVASVEEQENDF